MASAGAGTSSADITDVEFAICAYKKIRGANLAGQTGVVRKVAKPDGTAFYVKKIKFRKNSREETLVWNELDINEALTAELPDVVSRLIGSAVFREGDNRVAYIVFEGLVGVDGLDYMRRLPSDDEIARIVACVREKVVVLHRAEYVHRDLNQPNIFIMTDDDGKFVDCRLIDFGNAAYLGEFDGDAENEDELEEWARKKRRLYAKDKEMLDELEEKFKKQRDGFAERARARGGYRRTRRRGGKKRGQTRRHH